jgi:Spy/CpxP family protein refolding chaperone
MSVFTLSTLRIAATTMLVLSLAASLSAQEDPPVASPDAPVLPPAVAPAAEPKAPVVAGTRRRRSFPPGLAEARLIKERAEEIGVGEETLEKLEKLVAETREQEDALRQRTIEAENQVRDLLDESIPEEKALLEAAAGGSEVARETRRLRLQTSLRARALLTKEQLEKFMELRKKAFAKRRKQGRRPRR